MIPPSNTCLEADAALSVAQALAEIGPGGLDHVVGCPGCRARIEEWRLLEVSLAPGEVHPDFATQVVAALPAGRGEGTRTLAIGLLNGGLAFVTAVLVLMSLHAAPSLPGALAAAGVAAVAALGTGAYALRVPPR